MHATSHPAMPVIRQHLSEDSDDHACKLIRRLSKDPSPVRAQLLLLMVHKKFVPWSAVQRKPDPALNRPLRFFGPGREGLSSEEYIGSWEFSRSCQPRRGDASWQKFMYYSASFRKQ